MAIELPCPTIAVANQGLSVRVPGGVLLSVSVSETSPTPLAISKNLITQANAVLAPLSPIFTLIDAMLAVKDFAEAVPGLLTDPGALVEAIDKLVTNIGKLAGLVPQLSVPFLVVDIIDVVIEILAGIRVTLEALIDQNVKIAAAGLAAAEPGNEALGPIVTCAQDLNAQIQADLAAGSAPLNQFIGVLNLFLSLIGAPEIPSLDDLGDSPEEGLVVITEFETILRTARDAIPLP